MRDILGQARAVDILQTALVGGRGHHAYVFHGPVGVGKFTTAWAFARTLLCHATEADLTGFVAACRSCPSCRLLGDDAAAAGAHPDMHLVTKELARYSDDADVRRRKLLSIPVDIVRQAVIGPVYKAPQLGDKKVFIIDEAELLGGDSQNTLLKALEEPPAGTYLILVTAFEDKMLPTIRSRCQPVAFVPLGAEVIGQWLDKAAPQLEDRQRRWLVDFAGGSLGQAGLALEYDLLEWARVVLPALAGLVNGSYPTELGADMSERIDGFAKRWVEAHDGASKEAANQQAANLMWRIISQHARGRIADAGARCDPADPIAAEQMLTGWLELLDALTAAEANLARNVNLSLVTDHLVVGMYRALAGV